MPARRARAALLGVVVVAVAAWAGYPLLGGWVAGGDGRGTAQILPPPPELRAAAAALIDVDSGRLLYAKDAFSPRPPGELAKVLAALTALSRSGVDERVRVSARASDTRAISLNFQEGEELRLGDLVVAMLFRPGGDAAAALAEHVAGSSDAFARQMNLEIRRLGATSSNFVNPDGADADQARTTAFEMALIAVQALHNPFLQGVMDRVRATIVRRGQERALFNVNSFVQRTQGATGVKSSFTPQSGYGLIASARRGSRHLAAVILGSPSARERELDVLSLLEYGFLFAGLLEENPAAPRERYDVRDGDTLSEIAGRFEVPVAAILQMNEIPDPDALRSGQTLWIPR